MQPNIVELSIAAPDSAVVSQAQSLLTNAGTFKVATPLQYMDAGEMLKGIKGKIRELEAQEKGMTKPLDDSKKRIKEFFAKPIGFLVQAESTIKRSMLGFQQEQDRIRQEEQRKADEIARREREKIEAQKREAERKAREQQELLRKQAEEAAAAGRAEEAAKITAQAVKAEEKAAAKAEALEERAACVVAPVIQREMPKIAGQRDTETWHFEINDPSVIPAAFMTPDEVKIGKLVRSMKSDAQAVLGAGVRVYSRKGLASTAA